MLGDKIFDLLRQFTDRIYGNPGTTELSFLRFIPQDFKYYLALQDGVAVGMAEGYYLASNNLSIANLHAAPGLSNALGFIYTALTDRVPLLIIGGQQTSRYLTDEPRLYGDLANISKPLVKASFEAKTANEAIKFLNRAIKTSLTPPYGPTFVSIPEDLENVEIKYDIKPFYHKVNLCCDEEEIKEIMEIVNSKNNVAIVSGYEIDVFDAFNEITNFAEKLNSPVYAEPFASRPPYNSSHKLFAGDLPRRSSEINKILSDYDLILIIGGSINNVLFADDELLSNKDVIEITYDWIEASKRPWKTIVCNPKDFLNNAIKYARPHYGIFKKVNYPANDKVEEIIKTLYPNIRNYTVFDEIPSYRETLRKILGYKKGSLYANRAGFIGWAIPASFGYASTGKKSIAVVGDGSFNYSFQALWSASKYGGAMKVLVINNQGYNSLRNWNNNINYELLSPETSPWKLASSYNFEGKEFDDYKKAIEWLMSDDTQKLAEIKL
ncbi:thiamine pyrophosphate-binding protein [Acidianus sulfidivorans]|nr:thiamine pyrophosphate-binding protein [Acidianus sulfidivorans]